MFKSEPHLSKISSACKNVYGDMALFWGFLVFIRVNVE